ncbi:MocR-like transcription factor YczR [Parasphingorhabdus pacifica]
MSSPWLSRIPGRKLAELLGNGATKTSSRGVHSGVRQLVLDGRLPPGTRLPAERDIAESLGVSRTLVARALERLRDEGFIASRRGAGSWVKLPDGDRETTNGGWFPSGDPDIFNLAQAAPGAPPELGAATDRARVRLPEEFAGHGYQPHGLLPLRQRIAERFTARGLPTDPRQILVTNGAQHAFALVLRTLVAPGDRVLVEHPTYPNALEAIRGINATPVAAPMTEHGWDLDLVEAGIRQTSPRLAYLIPDFQNPTGFRLDEPGRERLAAALRSNRTTAVVDETLVDVDLGDQPPPLPMAAFGPERVIVTGSASKSFWGGIRLGWLRAPEELLQRVVTGRAALDLGSPVLEQLVLTELFDESEAVLRRRRAESIVRRDRLVSALAEHLPEWSFRVPDGGLALWCDLGEQVGSRLAVAAERQGVRLAAGSRFAVHGALERHVRLPYTLEPEHLEEAVRRLALASAGLGGLPAGGPSETQVT